MTKALTTHGCGKTWIQRGDRTSHCGGCHETFSNLSLFDKHFKHESDGSLTHLHPSVLTDGRDKGGNKLPLALDAENGSGVWKSAAKWDPETVFA